MCKLFLVISNLWKLYFKICPPLKSTTRQVNKSGTQLCIFLPEKGWQNTFCWKYFSLVNSSPSATDSIVHFPQMKAQFYSCEATISSTFSLIFFLLGKFYSAIFVSERTVPRLTRKWRIRASAVESIHCHLTRKKNLTSLLSQLQSSLP